MQWSAVYVREKPRLQRDSNPRPRDPYSGALTSRSRGRFCVFSCVFCQYPFMLCSCPASSFDASLEQNVKIFDGSEVRIEDSVTTVTVRHHEQLSRLTEFSINSERSSQIFFLAYPSISCIKGWICIALSLLHQNNYIFRSRNVRFVSSLILWRRKVWGKMTSTCRQDVKKNVNT